MIFFDKRPQLLEWVSGIVFVLVIASTVGCQSLLKKKAEGFKAQIPNGPTIDASGPVAVPGESSLSESTATLPLPAGTTITLPAVNVSATATANASAPANLDEGHTAPAPVTVSLPAPSQLTLTNRTQAVKTATSFKPPAPPTPTEIAQGKGTFMFYIVAAVFAVAAGILVYLQHFKAAAIAGLGAPLILALAHYASNSAALTATFVVAAIVLTLVAAWYLVRNHPEIIAKAKAELTGKPQPPAAP